MSGLSLLLASVSAPWRDQAACKQVDVDLFFPESRADKASIAKVCGSCPVRNECLEEALGVARLDDFGWWGGMSPFARRQLREERGLVGEPLLVSQYGEAV